MAIPWIEKSIRLRQHGKEEAALDCLNDVIDEMFRTDMFLECDNLLPIIPIERLEIDQLITILTATAMAKSKLTKRDAFYNAVKTAIIDRKEPNVKVLLMGLE